MPDGYRMETIAIRTENPVYNIQKRKKENHALPKATIPICDKTKANCLVTQKGIKPAKNSGKNGGIAPTNPSNTKKKKRGSMIYKQMLQRGRQNRARAKMYWAQGKSMREIGVLLGITRQAVHKTLNKGKK